MKGSCVWLPLVFACGTALLSLGVTVVPVFDTAYDKVGRGFERAETANIIVMSKTRQNGMKRTTWNFIVVDDSKAFEKIEKFCTRECEISGTILKESS